MGRDTFDEAFSIRMHRALSWLERAEKEKTDPDAAFIFFWISFNANYSIQADSANSFSETEQFKRFFDLIIKCDTSSQIYELVWARFTNEIRSILNNQYIYSFFWKMRSDTIGDGWLNSFENSKKLFNSALAKKDTSLILQILFSRLYTLRNQLIHGNATWNSAVNRSQVNDGFKLISALQPSFLSIMMEHHREDWGDLAFPIIE